MFAWDDLKYFLAFARHGSTLAASKALGVNQSTVARRLTELEEYLGRKLIDRRVTGYRLTELGEGLRDYAERVDEAVAAFERHCAARDSALTGTVRLTCTSSLAERLRRSPLIDAFHARYPGLRVEMLHSDRFLDLAKKEADIAIRPWRQPRQRQQSSRAQDRRPAVGGVCEPKLHRKPRPPRPCRRPPTPFFDRV